jgi:hypothetical protein
MPKRVNHLDIEVFPGVGFIFGRPHLEVIILPTAGESGPVIGITQTAGDLATLWIESLLRLLTSVADCHRAESLRPPRGCPDWQAIPGSPAVFAEHRRNATANQSERLGIDINRCRATV